MRLAAHIRQGVTSTSCPASRCRSTAFQPAHGRQPRLRLTVAAGDAMCRDVVNTPKTAPRVEGSAQVTFLGAGGHSVTINCPKDKYILEAGLDNGLELPYTCRGGICGACVGRIASGEIDMSDIDDVTFTLNEDELAQGMGLLCMARPVSDCTIETQSDWGYSLGVAEWKGATGEIAGKDVRPLMNG